MKKFLFRCLMFLMPIGVFLLIAILIPATPRASKSLLFANLKKDSLLVHVNSPRLIFIGGSNLSFGLNSQVIKDSLNINPINTGVHASIGLKYMIDNSLQYIKENDIVVLIPEYIHFFREFDYGSEELCRTIFDVNKSKISLLNLNQIINIVSYVPKLAFSKLKPNEYFNIEESVVYGINSFNQYGDTYTHWNLKKQDFTPFFKIKDSLNIEVFGKIKEFENKIISKGAILLISYPPFQDISFDNSALRIKEIEQWYIKYNFSILGTPERYRISNSLMFNTPYHLNKKGVDYRTGLLIEDLKSIIVRRGITM